MCIRQVRPQSRDNFRLECHVVTLLTKVNRPENSKYQFWGFWSCTGTCHTTYGHDMLSASNKSFNLFRKTLVQCQIKEGGVAQRPASFYTIIINLHFRKVIFNLFVYSSMLSLLTMLSFLSMLSSSGFGLV
jgi:hypothetical protein